MTHRKRWNAAAAALLLSGAVLAGCGDGPGPTLQPTVSAGPTSADALVAADGSAAETDDAPLPVDAASQQ